MQRPLAVIAALLVAGAAALMLAAGCGAKNEPPPAETSPPTPAPTVQDTTNPAPEGDGALALDAGARVFKARCALCHGPEGHGDGPASKGLNPKPRNFHDVAYMRTRSDAELLAVIHAGKGAMPRWAGVLSEEDIKAVLGHVRGFAKSP